MLKYSREILISILVIVIFWLVKCHKAVVIPEKPPVVKTIDDQKAAVVRDQSLADKLLDSAFAREIASAKKDASLLNKYNQLGAVLNDQADFINELLRKLSADSTKLYSNSFNRLLDTERQKDSACVQRAREKDNIISLKSVMLDAKDTLLKRKQASIDTCLSIQQKLQVYSADLYRSAKRRGQVYAGMNIIGQSYNSLTAIGPVIGYKTKKDLMIEGGLLLFGGKATQYQVGVKKVIKF